MHVLIKYSRGELARGLCSLHQGVYAVVMASSSSGRKVYVSSAWEWPKEAVTVPPTITAQCIGKQTSRAAIQPAIWAEVAVRPLPLVA